MGEQLATGFDGLSSYATDVDGAIAEADRIASMEQTGAIPTGPTSTNDRMEPVDEDEGAVTSGLKKLGGWVLAIGLILVVKALIYGGIHAFSDSGARSTYSSDDAPSYNNSSAGSTVVGDASSRSDSHISTTDNPGSLDAEPAEATLDNDDSVMAKPAPGDVSLTMPELRYCLAEDIRMSAQSSEMEAQQISDTDKFNRNVDGFNDAASDYNNACSHRSIISSQRPVAAAQVEGQRSALEAEGRGRVE